jgi:predicted metal-dependent HD superfamily phosphohydrolase
MEFEKFKTQTIGELLNKLPANLFYHSVDHTLDVLKAAEFYAESEKINEEDKILLLTAAVLHDSGFVLQKDSHEHVSSQIAKQTLPAYSYSDEQINRICGMIMATKIPQEPQNHIEMILCDADLDYLGRNDYYAISSLLYKEMNADGKIMSSIEWLNMQISFMEKHRYHTQTAISLRSEMKAKNLEDLRTQLNQLK